MFDKKKAIVAGVVIFLLAGAGLIIWLTVSQNNKNTFETFRGDGFSVDYPSGYSITDKPYGVEAKDQEDSSDEMFSIERVSLPGVKLIPEELLQSIVPANAEGNDSRLYTVMDHDVVEYEVNGYKTLYVINEETLWKLYFVFDNKSGHLEKSQTQISDSFIKSL